MLKWLRNLLDDPTDPVKHCDLYKDKAAGSCAHVDGPLCDFSGCSMLKDYRSRKAPDCAGGSPCTDCTEKRRCVAMGCVRLAEACEPPQGIATAGVQEAT